MASKRLLIRGGQVYDHEGDVHKPAADYDRVVESRKRALPHMLEAHRRVWEADIGMNRFIGRTR